MITGGVAWLARVVAAIVLRRPIPQTVGHRVDERPEGERHQWTEEEKRNARGL